MITILMLTAPSDAMIERTIKGGLKQGYRPLIENTADLELQHIGYLDDTSGRLEACDPRFVFNILEIKQKLDMEVANYAKSIGLDDKDQKTSPGKKA